MSGNSDFSDLLSALSAADARYLVVGGYAVAFHGQPRFTKDLDIWIDCSPTNATKVYTALANFGAPLSELSIDDLTVPGTVFQMGIAPSRIDILTAIDGIAFEDAWPNRTAGQFATTPMWVISVPDLIRNKRASGRPQDLSDVAQLEQLR